MEIQGFNSVCIIQVFKFVVVTFSWSLGFINFISWNLCKKRKDTSNEIFVFADHSQERKKKASDLDN